MPVPIQEYDSCYLDYRLQILQTDTMQKNNGFIFAGLSDSCKYFMHI